MRDMYEILDRWGAWAASDNSGVDWQPIAAGFKGLLPHGKKTRQQSESPYVASLRNLNALMVPSGKNCIMPWGLLKGF